jgi:KaiC/GvpD/RAD55 family RecA-like ATPase
MGFEELALLTLKSVLTRTSWEMNKRALQAIKHSSSSMNSMVQYIGSLHEQLNRDLCENDLKLYVQSRFRSADRVEEMLELVAMIEHLDAIPVEESQPFVAEYLGRELASQAATYVQQTLDGDRFDMSKLVDMVSLAVDLADPVDLDVIDYATSPPPSPKERSGLCTIGLGDEMDKHLRGGMANGEMMFYLAPSGVGKTSYLKHTGVSMAKQGEHVLDITLEISGNKVRARCDQSLTKLTAEERLNSPKLVAAERKKLKGKYYIKDWCSRNVSCDDIRALVKSMRAKGMQVTALCVDYLELMEPTKFNRHGERFNHSLVAKEMRRMANELDVKLVSAWQTNRAGSTKHVINKEDVSECWDIVKHADIILGLNQGDEELRNEIMRINIIKQRESTARPIEYYHSDLERMDIRPGGEKGEDHESLPQDLGGG